MDPMTFLASQHNDGLARRRSAEGWAPRTSRRGSVLRRIGRLARPVRGSAAARRARRSPSLGTFRPGAYPRPESG
jgi:hypothetical protein